MDEYLIILKFKNTYYNQNMILEHFVEKKNSITITNMYLKL